MSKKILAVLFVLVFVLGLAGGFFYDKFFPTKFSNQQAGVCWEQSKKRLENSGLIVGPNNSGELKSVNGEIMAISGNIITLKIKQFDLLSDPALDIRFIETDDATAVSRVLVKNSRGALPASYTSSTPTPAASGGSAGSASGGNLVLSSADMEKMKLTASSTPPAFDYQTIKIGDLKVGDKISVLAETDIRDQKNIKAKNIAIIPF